MTRRRHILPACLFLLAPGIAPSWLYAAPATSSSEATQNAVEAPDGAGVQRSSSTGFAIRHETTLATKPIDAYRALTEEVGQWWDSDHTVSGDASNLWIDTRPGGCLCESLPEGGSVTHLKVIHADPGRLLRLTGGLGPLQAEAVSGSMSWNFEETGTQTRMILTYNVWGDVDGGLGTWAKPVGRVLKAQFDRLAIYADSRSATARLRGGPEQAQPWLSR